MAELTKLESKLGEVTGLAMAAQGRDEKGHDTGEEGSRGTGAEARPGALRLPHWN